MNATMNWVTFYQKIEVSFVALSWIVQTSLNLCECQVIIEATVPLFVI